MVLRTFSPRTRRLIVIALAVFALADVALIAKYAVDDRVLEHAIAIDPALPPSEKVIQAVNFLETRVKKRLTTDRSFLPGLSFLRPTPRQVLEAGGDCADRSRLLIALLQREGVSASKVALHDDAGQPQHAVVEVAIEDADRAMVVDALFGMYFPKPDGGYYSVWDIKADERILHERIRALSPSQPQLREYPLDLYTYEAPRTINWNKSLPMRTLHRVLSAAIGDAVDRLPRPGIVAEPVLMTLVGAVMGQVAFVAALFVVGKRRAGARTAAAAGPTGSRAA